MPVSLYDITVPVFIKHIQTLQKLLTKGVEFTNAADSKISEQALIQSKLIEDMGGLIFQIQRVSGQSVNLAVHLGKIEPYIFSDVDSTFPELQARLAKSIEILESLKKETVDASADEEIEFRGLKFTGTTFATGFLIPNFYFHFVTAYALLRKEGVQIGKADFLGRK